jgi:hypothetical protein
MAGRQAEGGVEWHLMAREESDGGELKRELERLYALHPAAFTAARDELAARLRREGRRQAAAEIKGLPRPTPSSWAVSRLMRLEPGRFQALLSAGRKARQAQRQVLAGRAAPPGPAAAQLREALRSARQLVEELRRRGLELLAAGGRTATARTADRLAADLQALAFTSGADGAVSRGWLDHDLEAPGFEVLAGLQAAAGRADAPVRRLPPPAPRPPAAPTRTTRRTPAQAPEGPTPQRATPPPPEPGSARREQARHLPAREDGARGDEAREREERRREAAELTRRRRVERQRERLARAQAAVRRAAGDSAQLRDAALAAAREAAATGRRADRARRDAERAEQRAERGRELLERARERLAHLSRRAE